MSIYKQYTYLQLNEQYNNRLRVPAYQAHFEKWEAASRETEYKYHPVKNIYYGSHSRECLDIYPAQRPGSKTLVFIHGGYWKSMAKESFHFVAGGFQSYDVTVVLIEYPLMPEASMMQLVTSSRNAMNWVQQNIHLYNGDASQLYVAGHSAGAHLAVMLMISTSGQPVALMGVYALSGLFNLLPIQLCELNDVLQLDALTLQEYSPVELSPTINCSLLVVVGSDESDEFKDQSAELYRCWKEQVPVQLIQAPGLNHFSIVEAFADKTTSFHKIICSRMEI